MSRSRVQLGFEALVAVLHIQANVIRPIDAALERAHGANLTGYEVLARLAQAPAGTSVRALAEQVVVSPSRVSRVTAEFGRRGLVACAPSPDDGRLSLVRLTEQGQAELRAMRRTFERALDEHFLAHLSAAQVRALIDIGRRLGAPSCQ
jgi:DNA-binding MarR family transcriptional regulator